MGQTVAEKIFDTHVVDRPAADVWVLRLDAVFCHEITTPTAIMDLRRRGKDRVFDPIKIKAVIDHVTPAKDSKTALQGKVLRDWARRHQIADFFDVGRNGVCHVLFPEKGFVRPGTIVIMGDSHTCTDGAFGAFTPGVGTTDLAVGILKGVCAFRTPRTMKVRLVGALQPGVFAKDVILSLIGRIGMNGATDRIVEFDGPVVSAMNMDARMTLCNMTVEAGGTCGICYPDEVTADYLWEFIRSEYADPSAAAAAFRRWWPDPDAAYEEVVVHEVSTLEPVTTFGFQRTMSSRCARCKAPPSTRFSSAPAPTAAWTTCALPRTCSRAKKSTRACAPSSARRPPRFTPRRWRKASFAFFWMPGSASPTPPAGLAWG
jgi:3-isopropylmalate/(R)-2-methylmalate dehydratase large subunit